MSQGIVLKDPQLGTVYPCALGRTIKVGREDPTTQSDIACRDKHVSRRHCEITVESAERIRIVDLSAYGTYLNGEKLVTRQPAYAKVGDRIVLGHQYQLWVCPHYDTEASTLLDARAPGAALGTGPGVPPTPTHSHGTPGGGAPSAEGPPRVGARYQIIGQIARGGMGVIYKAMDELLDRPCAIKVLLAGGRASPDMITRFKREGKLAARLGQHPGIVGVFDLGTVPETGVLYFVMDFIEGESLDQSVSKGLKHDVGVQYLYQLTKAVAYAHEQGVIHRDLKPQNVLVTAQGTVHLTDFGIAKALDDGSGLTAMGVPMGTPQFMAPEQIKDSRAAGPPADIYGLGGILYLVLTRQVAYNGTRLDEILRKVKKGSYTLPRDVDPTIEPGIAAICERALAVDPKQRQASANELASQLEAWLKRRGMSSAIFRQPG